jgi:hypothetical protein
MIVALFVFVPAVISEILLLAFSYIVLAQMGKKESTED